MAQLVARPTVTIQTSGGSKFKPSWRRVKTNIYFWDFRFDFQFSLKNSRKGNDLVKYIEREKENQDQTKVTFF